MSHTYAYRYTCASIDIVSKMHAFFSLARLVIFGGTYFCLARLSSFGATVFFFFSGATLFFFGATFFS